MLLFQKSGKYNLIHPDCVRYLTLVQSGEGERKGGRSTGWGTLYKHARSSALDIDSLRKV